ncbi:MAG: GumC family protein, partial [Hyphomicrobiales bacterium]
MSLPARHGDFQDLGVYSPPGGQERLLDLPQLLSILRRHARLILATLAIAVLAAVAYRAAVAPQYTASATILVDPREQRVLGTKAVIEGIGQDAAFVESQVGLIQSSALSAHVVDKLKLTEDAEFAQGNVLSRLVGLLRDGGATGDPMHDAQVLRNETIERFREHLSVRRRGLTYVLDVQFNSADPDKAARIANAIADAYIEDQIAMKTGATAGASRWLGNRIDELRQRVGASERAVAAYKEEHNIVEFSDAQTGDTLNKRQIESLNQQLIAARARTADSLAKYEQVKRISEGGADPGSLPDAHKSDVLSRLRVQQATVARTEAEYSLTYGPEHPFLKQVRAQLGNIRSEINKELARILASAKTEYEIARARETSLEQSLAALGRESASDNKIAVRLRELEREAQADRELFSQFLARAKETTEESALHVADARIVSRALVPVAPSSPGVLLILAIALTGGVAVASGLVLVAENMARGYRSRQALEADAGVACYGVCPQIEARDIPVAG